MVLSSQNRIPLTIFTVNCSLEKKQKRYPFMTAINHKLLNRLGDEISRRGWHLSFAESMTSGFITSVWSLQIDSGNYLLGGIVCFEESVKTSLLLVPEELLSTYTAESIEVSLALLQGLKQVLPAEVRIAVTGLAYEGTDKHPSAKVGDVFIAVAVKDAYLARSYALPSAHAADTYIKTLNCSLEMLASLLDQVKS
ncbi:hypothetical protein GQF61_17550 [Sphingobacterium sp. DK4209]|uniref:CinA C-terminal domain-containing protein n=1 Tax=Sphingobacterium zhuxiongii TaxID=2662364 RepID=A0A5Q0QDB4_9SPHI|nr:MULTISPECIES: CinA family protein [unclassified Sphingobacterium]MVZ67655.1 hypothetical protein [Sphingobacterium sp. DK4209]QGA26911.1 hypothetical protein GFH32_11555 [Sphingobacterium sp. dk4302]